MKTFLFLLLALPCTAYADGTYGIHLFFDEKEFVDVLTISRVNGALHGHMSVPNDFEGEISAIAIEGDTLTFDLPVPKNATRPDMTFHYVGRFFDASETQLTGTVTLKDSRDFVASFVGFRR